MDLNNTYDHISDNKHIVETNTIVENKQNSYSYCLQDIYDIPTTFCTPTRTSEKNDSKKIIISPQKNL